MDRRLFLTRSIDTARLAALAAAGLLVPMRVQADWPAAGFNAKKLQPAMQGLLGSEDIQPSDQIELLTKEIAENGSSVPVAVNSKLANTEAIYLFAEKNPAPALAEFMFTNKVDAHVSCRIKLGESGNLIVVVRAGGKLYSKQGFVKVTAGGCASNTDYTGQQPLLAGDHHGQA